MTLQPSDIASAFSITEIEAKITSILSAIALTEESMSDKFADGQADQQVRRQSLKDLYTSLAIWVKAKNLLTGATTSTTELISGNFNPAIPRI